MIKKIALTTLFIVGGFGGIYAFVLLKNGSSIDNNSQIQVENKVPIEPYLFNEIPSYDFSITGKNKFPMIENSNEVLEKIGGANQEQKSENKELLRDQVEKLQKQELVKKEEEQKQIINNPKPIQEAPKTPQIHFSKEDLFDDEKIENQIREIHSKRVKNKLLVKSSNVEIQNKKMVIDFGANSIKGMKKIEATGENKLLRTILAMDKIAVILDQEINSTLSGSVTGHTRDNVYSYMGRAVLIPKGSKVLGEYVDNNKVGENRLQIVWTRIVTPQGVNIQLASKTQDLKGGSGAVGEVDNKLWERYGFALTISTLTNAGLIGLSNLTQKVPNYQAQEILSQGASDVSDVAKAIMQEQIKIRPVITIKAGEIIFISPQMDIFFPKPRGKEVLVQYFNRLEEEKQSSNKEEK